MHCQPASFTQRLSAAQPPIFSQRLSAAHFWQRCCPFVAPSCGCVPSALFEAASLPFLCIGASVAQPFSLPIQPNSAFHRVCAFASVPLCPCL